MSHSIFFGRHRRQLAAHPHDPRPHSEIEREHHRHLLLVGVLGLLFGALAFATLDQSISAPSLALPTDLIPMEYLVGEAPAEQPVLEFPTRELPREWQWEPAPLDVEHMHMRGPATGRSFIRDGGSR